MLFRSYNGGFALALAVRLSSLTAASRHLHSLPGAAQFQNNLAFVVLGDCPYKLAHQDPRGIGLHQVWFRHGDQCEAVFLEIGNCRLLDHQITCQPIQLLDNDGFDAIRMERRHQCRPSGPVGRFRCAADAFLAEHLEDSDVVHLGVTLDRRHLAGKPVALNLALTAHSEICEAFVMVAMVGASVSVVKAIFSFDGDPQSFRYQPSRL